MTRESNASGENDYTNTFTPKVERVCDKSGGEHDQRKDDTRETAEKRIEVYEESTAPLIAYYEKAGTLKNFNAEKDPAEVFAEIVAEIGE